MLDIFPKIGNSQNYLLRAMNMVEGFRRGLTERFVRRGSTWQVTVGLLSRSSTSVCTHRQQIQKK